MNFGYPAMNWDWFFIIPRPEFDWVQAHCYLLIVKYRHRIRWWLFCPRIFLLSKGMSPLSFLISESDCCLIPVLPDSFGVFVPLHNFYGVPQTSVPHVLWVRATLVPPAKFLRPVFFCVAKPIPQHSIDDDWIAKYSMLSHSMCLILVGFPEQKKIAAEGK